MSRTTDYVEVAEVPDTYTFAVAQDVYRYEATGPAYTYEVTGPDTRYMVMPYYDNGLYFATVRNNQWLSLLFSADDIEV